MWKSAFYKCKKTTTQTSFTVTAKLISAFVFATWLVHSLFFLNSKFQASNCLLWLYNLVCVAPGRKPRRPVLHMPRLIWAATWENRIFAYANTKTQISFAVTAKLISAFVFATWIVQSLYFLNPKFQVPSHLKWLRSQVCVRPGRKPRRPVLHMSQLISGLGCSRRTDKCIFEPRREKTGLLHMRKQRRRSASR